MCKKYLFETFALNIKTKKHFTYFYSTRGVFKYELASGDFLRNGRYSYPKHVWLLANRISTRAFQNTPKSRVFTSQLVVLTTSYVAWQRITKSWDRANLGKRILKRCSLQASSPSYLVHIWWLESSDRVYKYALLY